MDLRQFHLVTVIPGLPRRQGGPDPGSIQIFPSILQYLLDLLLPERMRQNYYRQ